MAYIRKIDLSDITSAAGLHERLASTLAFPAHYGGNWDAFWDCITEEDLLPDVLILQGLELFEARLPREWALMGEVFTDYNNHPETPICALEVSDGYSRPFLIARVEAKPGPDADTDRGGAFVNCYVKTDAPHEALRITHDEVAEAGWEVINIDDVIETRLANFREDDPARAYAKQVCIDGIAVVFHTYPVEDETGRNEDGV